MQKSGVSSRELFVNLRAGPEMPQYSTSPDTTHRSPASSDMALSRSRERRSAWRTGSGTRWMQHVRTSETPDSSVTPCPTDTYTGLNPSPSVVRIAAPHVEPDAPTSGHESPLAAHVTQ